jgi:outer membrane protein OmpA-like peptidoglycan-associated protein
MDRIEKKPVRHEELRLQDMKGSHCLRELRRRLVAHRSTHARLDHDICPHLTSVGKADPGFLLEGGSPLHTGALTCFFPHEHALWITRVVRCEHVAIDAFQDTDGCPDLDHVDSCLSTPEDFDGFDDRCPLAAEDFDGDQDEDGCPEQRSWRHESPALQIGQKTYFAPGSHDIRPREVAFLDEPARILIENPRILELRIEEHTDGRDDAARNLEVSRRRAQEVRSYLIARGIEPARLTLRAFPDSLLLCDEAYRTRKDLTKSERDTYNRRVAYKIVRRLPGNGTVLEQHP